MSELCNCWWIPDIMSGHRLARKPLIYCRLLSKGLSSIGFITEMFGKHKECSWYEFVFQISLPVCWIDVFPIHAWQIQSLLHPLVSEKSFQPVLMLAEWDSPWIIIFSRKWGDHFLVDDVTSPFCFWPANWLQLALICLPSAYVNFFKRSLRSQNTSVKCCLPTPHGLVIFSSKGYRKVYRLV